MKTARDVMTTNVLHARADWTLEELAAFLDRHDITGAPVVEGDALIGLVSVTDLARAWQGRSSVTATEDVLGSMSRAGVDASEMGGFGVESTMGVRVRDVMTPVVFSVEEQTPIAEIASMMVRGRIHRVIVLRGREPVGIVSSLDLLRVLQPGALTSAPIEAAS